MEENMKGGQENHEERRDYANKEGQRSGYSSEGRKLRPRRKVSPAPANQEGEYRQRLPHNGEGRPGYGNRSSYGSEGRQGGYGSRSNYGSDNRQRYGEGRSSYGEGRPSYGEGRQGGYGSRSNFGSDNRQRYGEGRPSYGSRPSYGEGRQGGYGNRSNHGGDNRQRYGEGRPSYGEGRQGGYGSHGSYGSDSRQGYGQQHRSGFAGENRPVAPKAPAKALSKKAARKTATHFTQTDEIGINQMLSRKPRLENMALSDNDTVPTPIKEEIRLNKFIANSGVCSRREADTFIQAGVVTVNGEVVTELGTKINVLKDDVRFNGERLKGEEKVYIVMNKPKGFVTSASDPHAEKTVMDLLKGCTLRVFPVGRLDKNTTGVLMFTNDGEIAEQLTHPSYNKKKIYQVILDKALDEEDKEKILTVGLDLADGNIKADELEYIDAEDHRRLGIEIHSGKNRIVRRIFESLGYTVKALDRVYFAGLTKKGLKKGEWRYLSEGEVNVLKMGAYV